MKILKFVKSIIILINSFFLFQNKKISNKNIYKSKKITIQNKFYLKSDLDNEKEKNNWKETYLDKKDLDALNINLVKGLKFNGKNLDNFTYFDPTKTIWKNESKENFQMFAIINNEYQIQPWNELIDIIKEDDEVIFVKKYINESYLNGVFPNTDNYYCKIKNTNFFFSAGRPWLIELKIPLLKSGEYKTIWKPIYVPNTKSFCDKSDLKSNTWAMYLNNKDLKVDINKEIKLGKMLFLNNKFIDSEGYIELVKDKKPYLEGDYIRIPYKAGENIVIENLQTEGEYKTKKIKNPTPVFSNWYFGSGSYIKPYIATGFIHHNEFSNEKKIVDNSNLNSIVKSILKSNNYFGFNVFSDNFKKISANWVENLKNNKMQELTITMEDTMETKKYNYEIWFQDLINEENKNKITKSNEPIINDNRKEKRREKANDQEGIKNNFKQNIMVSKHENSLNINNKNIKFSWSEKIKKEIKSKKILFILLLISILIIFIFILKRDKKR